MAIDQQCTIRIHNSGMPSAVAKSFKDFAGYPIIRMGQFGCSVPTHDVEAAFPTGCDACEDVHRQGGHQRTRERYRSAEISPGIRQHVSSMHKSSTHWRTELMESQLTSSSPPFFPSMFLTLSSALGPTEESTAETKLEVSSMPNCLRNE
jgi:hypothetical protein